MPNGGAIGYLGLHCFPNFVLHELTRKIIHYHPAVASHAYGVGTEAARALLAAVRVLDRIAGTLHVLCRRDGLLRLYARLAWWSLRPIAVTCATSPGGERVWLMMACRRVLLWACSDGSFAASYMYMAWLCHLSPCGGRWRALSGRLNGSSYSCSRCIGAVFWSCVGASEV